MLRTALAAMALACALLAGCTDLESLSDDDPKKSDTAPSFDGDARAAEVEQAFIDAAGGRPISSLCDAAYTHWSCFYSGVTAPNEEQIRVAIDTDGGWSESDLEQLANEAALHWFNFVGPADEDLGVVIVRTNGVDSNHYREDVPLLAR